MRAFLLSLMIVVVIVGLPFVGRTADESLVLFFPFEEGQGDTTEDKSGNGNTGALMNGPKWQDGKYGNGLFLGG